MVLEINLAEIPEASRKSSKVSETVTQLMGIAEGKALVFTPEDGQPQTIMLRVKKANDSGLLPKGVSFVAKRRSKQEGDKKVAYVYVYKK